MARIAREQYEALRAAIGAHDFLARIVDVLEHNHRLVFHANERVDWGLVRRSAEQILIAEIVSRHQGNIDGVYFALRAMENGGKPWGVAIHDLATAMHSYFTTPLGALMRKDLFGDEVVFIAADAYEWVRERDAEGAAES